MWVSVSLDRIFEVILNGGIYNLYCSLGRKAVTGTEYFPPMPLLTHLHMHPGSQDASDWYQMSQTAFTPLVSFLGVLPADKNVPVAEPHYFRFQISKK